MNHDLSSDYWNNRYLLNDAGWDLSGVSPPLKNYVDQLSSKNLKILIPGAGNSYEAEYLFQNGFTNFYICDFAKEPLENLKKRCPGINKNQLLQTDFFAIDNKDFDLIIEQTFFCALHPSLRKKYFEKMHSLLKPNGKLVGLLFEDKLNEDRPPFGGEREEYETYFKDLFSVKTYESCYNSVKPRQDRELFINLVKR